MLHFMTIESQRICVKLIVLLMTGVLLALADTLTLKVIDLDAMTQSSENNTTSAIVPVIHYILD